MVKWKTKWEGIDSQEVGLEAAILQRKRNSSLIESSCAEDVTGLKLGTEIADHQASLLRFVDGRRAFRRPVKVSRKGCWRYRKCECRHE